MARATHIAVNLLLIVVLTMQTGLSLAVRQVCSGSAATPLTCGGCGCCEVDAETPNCGCCSGTESSPAKSESCGKEASAKIGCCGQSEPQSHASALKKAKQDVAAERGLPDVAVGCKCLVAPQPFDSPTRRFPPTETRDVLPACGMDNGIVRSAVWPATQAASDLLQRIVVAHFTQVALCVWRL